MRGLALILVLWVLALMVLLASAFSVSVRSEAQLGHAAAQRIRAGLAAEAGVRRAVVELLAPPQAAPRRRDPGAAVPAATDTPSSRQRRTFRFQFDDARVTMLVIPESAFVDINVAAEPLIRGVVQGAVAALQREASLVDSVTAAILDWRDLDDRPRDFGAEVADYRAAGRQGPRDHPFLSVSELAEVAGVDGPLFEALRAQVTVYSFSPQVDAMAASEAVLLALPDAEPAAVQEFVERRARAEPEREIVALLTSSRAYLARRSTPTYTVLVEAETPSGVRAVRRAVVKVNPRAAQRVTILAWHHDAGGHSLPPPPSPAGPEGSRSES
jgi:general secretion pathway protein K